MGQREELPVAQAKAGDPDAWAVIFRRFRLPLFVYAAELLQDEQASLDLVQDTFIAAVRHLSELRQDEKMGSWLFVIAHQKCIQRWRKSARETEALEEIADAAPAWEEAPDEWLVRHEQEAEFIALLGRLPMAQRAVLLLYFVEDFSIEEIARVTESAPGTVKSRLHYAKKAVRKLLERYDR